jgi:hypothetical protein
MTRRSHLSPTEERLRDLLYSVPIQRAGLAVRAAQIWEVDVSLDYALTLLFGDFQSTAATEPTEANPHLKRIHAWVPVRERRIRNVHKPQFSKPIPFPARYIDA